MIEILTIIKNVDMLLLTPLGFYFLAYAAFLVVLLIDLEHVCIYNEICIMEILTMIKNVDIFVLTPLGFYFIAYAAFLLVLLIDLEHVCI